MDGRTANPEPGTSRGAALPWTMGLIGTASDACHVARSLAGYLALGIYTCVVGPPALLVARLTRRPSPVIRLGLFGIRAWLGISGVRFRLIGAEHVPAGRPAVYCVNHTSHLDVVAFAALYRLCPALRILYKREVNQVPLIGSVFSAAGFIAIDRAHHDRAVEALDAGTGALRRGMSVLAAPEGTRSPDGTLQPFKKGLFVMALRAQAPIVPVAIIGAHYALPKGGVRITPRCILIRVGQAIETSDFDYEDRDTLISLVREALLGLLQSPHDPDLGSCSN
jgi:1-acyl-sn-glycerol-3-phosphate acyltransferase